MTTILVWSTLVISFNPLFAVGWETKDIRYTSVRELTGPYHEACNSTLNLFNCTSCLGTQNCIWCLPIDNGNQILLPHCAVQSYPSQMCQVSFNTYSNIVVCSAKPIGISNVSVTLMIIFFTACCCLCLSTLCYCGLRSYIKSRNRVHLVLAGAIEEAQVQWSPYSYDRNPTYAVRANPGYNVNSTAVEVECVEWSTCQIDSSAIPLGYQTSHDVNNGVVVDDCNYAISVPISTPVSFRNSSAHYIFPTPSVPIPQHTHRLD